jgi:uncharacterized membrane protein
MLSSDQAGFLAVWQSDDGSGIASIIYGCLILIALVVLGYVGVTWVRKWARSTSDIPDGGFSLSDLRALHREGKISNEEFEKTRSMIVAAAKKSSQYKDLLPPPTP